MHTEHKTFDSRSFDDIVSVVVGRLEAGRHLLHDAPPTVCEAMNAILDDATAKLEHLLKLSTEFDWPEDQPGGSEQGKRTGSELRKHDAEVPITSRRQTARLTDKADEAEAGIHELLAALEMADGSDVDSETVQHAVRGFIKLARAAHERAREAARMASELHEGTHRDRAA